MPDRVERLSPDVIEDRLERLKAAVPEAFTDGVLDPRGLVSALALEDPTARERYGLSWAGRGSAVRTLRQRSPGSLHPDRERSTDFDDAPHVFVEGDNLEVLRLLQRGYHESVRLVYLDVPYNTGKDFVYKDDFTSTLAAYLQLSGQEDEAGNRLVANPDTAGRFHSNWLTMMFPRLALARNLLTEDGLILVSIDDNEVHNLRLIMDEVFGTENFLATLVWDRGHSQQAGIFKEYHEYVLAYAKSKSHVQTFESTEGGQIVAGALKRVSRKNPAGEFTFPAGTRCEAPDGTEFQGTWGGAEKTTVVDGRFIVADGVLKEDVTLSAGWTQASQMERFFAGDNEVLDTRGQRVTEFYFSSSGKLKCIKERSAETPATVQRWGTQGSASAALTELFDGVEVFDRPKPVGMIRDFVRWVCSRSDDIVMDFFAGAGTTGHAVFEQNAEDGVDRRFVLVNLPEPTSVDSTARAAGYDTVSQVCIDRLKKAANTLEANGTTFRVFSLGGSNFKIWDRNEAPANPEELAEALVLFEDSLLGDATDEAILWEILIRAGVKLDAFVEQIEVDDGKAWRVDDHIAVSLTRLATLDHLEAVIRLGCDVAVFLDQAFSHDDALLTNASLIAQDAGVVLRTF